MLDASVALAWCFEDEGDEAMMALERARVGVAHAPAVWPLEVGNALLVAERRRRLTEAEATRFLELVAALAIEIEPTAPLASTPALLSLARAHDLSLYDASYLELALRSGLPLATLDDRLGRAARAAGVALVAGA